MLSEPPLLELGVALRCLSESLFVAAAVNGGNNGCTRKKDVSAWPHAPKLANTWTPHGSSAVANAVRCGAALRSKGHALGGARRQKWATVLSASRCVSSG